MTARLIHLVVLVSFLSSSSSAVTTTNQNARQQPIIDALMTERTVRAAKAAIVVGRNKNETDDTFDFDSVEWYHDNNGGPTRAIVAVRENVCYAALDGQFTSKSSWLTSTYQTVCSNTSPSAAASSVPSCCEIRSDWVDAYETASWKDVWEQKLKECQALGRPVFISGHKFGAGLAQVAAIRLTTSSDDAVVDPLLWLISFSQPPITNVEQCRSKDKSRWIRFLNTREDLRVHVKWLVYDNTRDDFPSGPLTWNAGYVGHLYVLSGDDPGHWAYLGLDSAGPSRPYDRHPYVGMMTNEGVDDDTPSATSTLGFDPPTDAFGGYYDRLLATQQVYESGGTDGAKTYPIETNGFESAVPFGKLCNIDEECQSRDCSQSTWDGPLRCKA
jgi:Lipase (class 3)